MTRIVVALGGNALLRRGEPAEAETQRRNVARAASALAAVAHEHELLVTHGNGPQVGLLALEALAYKAVAPYPLDVLGAESQGMIGYLLAQALRAEIGREVAAVLTQVVVAADDPAFLRPTKPIGPVYSKRTAQRFAAKRGWTVAPDGQHFRRVVASPEPQAIVELDTIAALLAEGVVVVCAGGGGIPVVADGPSLHGVEAVIDKDLTAALLAEQVNAERLVLLTDVSYVERNWGSAEAEPIEAATPAELRRLAFAAGSMGPKVEAACRFVERTGGEATIGALTDLRAVAAGRAGTQIAARVTVPLGS
jgi:carbamate kinase